MHKFPDIRISSFLDNSTTAWELSQQLCPLTDSGNGYLRITQRIVGNKCPDA